MRAFAIAVWLSIMLAWPVLAFAEPDAAETCDRLAADPFAGLGPKSWDKPFQAIDAKAAVPACEEAMRLHPDDARYRLQAAVAYLAAGDRARAKPLLEALVAENNAAAMVLLANISSDKEAAELIERAAALSNPAALIFRAFAQLTGDGTNQNIREGIRLLTRAADLGNTEAMIILAGVYFEGQFGVPPDAAEGRRLILEAARLGNPSAQEVLARIKRAQAEAASRGANGPSAPSHPGGGDSPATGASPAP